MSTKDNKKKQIDGKDIALSFELPSGKKVDVLEGKGKDSQFAAKMSEGAPEQYMPALMHVLVRIDGEKLAIEDFEELPLRDYNKLQTEFSGLYFL